MANVLLDVNHIAAESRDFSLMVTVIVMVTAQRQNNTKCVPVLLLRGCTVSFVF